MSFPHRRAVDERTGLWQGLPRRRRSPPVASCRAPLTLVTRLAPLRRDPARAGIFSDFDGTLSPIVPDPALAEPLAGVPELLGELARWYQVVAVVSGRPAAFLAARLPASILLAGLYGLEVQHHGEYQVDPEAERWREVVSATATRLRAAAPSGVLVEPKDLSVTCHYRANPALGPQVTALAREVAAATGLVVRADRKSVELLPPVRTDKGTVIAKWAAPVGAACYLGDDDTGDLAAFHAPRPIGRPRDRYGTDRGAQRRGASGTPACCRRDRRRTRGRGRAAAGSGRPARGGR